MLILVSSAEINYLKEMRTSEYIKTIDWITNNLSHYNIVWLECFSNEEPPYLKGKFPFYCSNSHNKNYRNKGSNL